MRLGRSARIASGLRIEGIEPTPRSRSRALMEASETVPETAATATPPANRSRRIASPGGHHAGPVGGDLGVALPGKEAKRQGGVDLGPAAQEDRHRDAMVLEEVVAQFVARHEAKLVGLEGFEKRRRKQQEEPP